MADSRLFESILTAGPGAVSEPRSPGDLGSGDLQPAAMQEFVPELTALHRRWLERRDPALPADEFYLGKLANRTPLEPYELALATAISERYPVDATHIVEIGSGWGGLAILLARLGFNVTGYEGNAARYAGCSWHIAEQISTYPILRQRLRFVGHGLFPEVFSDAHLAPGKLNVCIATNITSSYSAEHEGAMIAAAAAFDELILDLARFGVRRDAKAEREAFFEEVTARWFSPVERLIADEPYEYWRFRSRSIAGRRSRQSATPLRDHDLATPAPTVGEAGLQQPQLSPTRRGTIPWTTRMRRRDLFRTISDEQIDPLKTIPEQLAVFAKVLKKPWWDAQVLRDLQALLARVDSVRLDALRAWHAQGLRKADTVSGYKYFDFVFYTLQKLLLAYELGLDRGPPRRVLDIGTAGGHFPFVCRFFGHEVVGIDIESPLYEDIARCLGVERTIARVEAYRPLPALGGRFDLITACNTTFNQKRVEQINQSVYWRPAEWQFFLNDLVSNQLRYPGELYLQINKELYGNSEGAERLVRTRDILTRAAREGATISHGSGMIRMSFPVARVIRLE